MTGIEVVSDEVDPVPGRDALARGRLKVHLVIAVLTIGGLLIGSYPAIAQWFSNLDRAGAVTGYVESVERAGSDRLAEIREAAHAYNAAMPEVLLSDPYSKADARASNTGAWEHYREQLLVEGSETMARVSVPAGGIDLPVYHGTDDATLSKGAGHLFGSSLPVGGAGTHSVITAHTALAESKMFDGLAEVELGDTFTITVAGEEIAYRVEDISIVLPEEIEGLATQTGRDLVTLVTCTPYAVNTHRLLVRGERLDVEEAQRSEKVTAGISSAGFPWWALWVGGGAVLISGFAVWASRPKSQAP